MMKSTNTDLGERRDEFQLSYRELSTVLAGLRQIQEMLEDEPGVVLEMIHFADCDPLTVEEIDELCDYLNEEHFLSPTIKAEHLS